MVVLSYVPDIGAQIGLAAGWRESRLLSHSLVFALAVSPPLAAVLARLAVVSFARALVIVAVSLLTHDVLDLAQATDRAPWWPLSHRALGLDVRLIPSDLVSEGAIFAGVFLVFLVLRHAGRRTAGRPAAGVAAASGPSWWAAALVVAVMLAALVTHALRDAREADLERGRALVEGGAYRAGLDVLDRADRWPSPVKPGRVDYLRAEAYAGLGDRRAAERHYVKADRADPTYFWTVADLALFHASSPAPAAERRRLVAPYVVRLRSDFAGHRELSQVLARIERRLAATTHDSSVSK
jgi:hypothetical protein